MQNAWMLYHIENLTNAIDQNDKTFAEFVLLSIWVQPEGRGMPEVIANLLEIVELESFKFSKSSELTDAGYAYRRDLRKWKKGLLAIQTGMQKLRDHASPEQLAVKAGAVRRHPLSRHGFTDHALYSAAWNPHENGFPQTSQHARHFRELQWWWIRAQAYQVEKSHLAWADYMAALKPELDPTNPTVDLPSLSNLLKDKCRINFSGVGHALRLLSQQSHDELLSPLVECCAMDLSKGAHQFVAISELTGTWRTHDAATQKERQTIIDAFRLAAEKFLDLTSRAVLRKRSQGGRRGKGGIHEGFIGHPSQEVKHEEPPEPLDDFVGWLPTVEVVDDGSVAAEGGKGGGADDIELAAEIKSGLEAPRLTGLHLVDPEKLRGHLAKAKHQSHHLAMMRQGFGWDNNCLSPVERGRLLELVEEVCALARESDADFSRSIPASRSMHVTQSHNNETDPWWPKAVIAVSWLCGRPMEQVLNLRYLTSAELSMAKDDLFGVGQKDGIWYWRLPLRMATPITKHDFSHAVARIDHVLLPDDSGVVEALVGAHLAKSSRGMVSGGMTGGHAGGATRKHSLVFSWRKRPEHRNLEVQALLQAMDNTLHDRPLKMHLIDRALRIELMNLAPDRTVAWTLAGAKEDHREPRMFYCAHSSQALVDWGLQAQAKLLQGANSAITSVQEASDVIPSMSLSWPESYAGAKFLPELSALQKLCRMARAKANDHPPASKRQLAINTDGVQTSLNQPDTSPTLPLSPKAKWDDQANWRDWHDHVVLWSCLVQAMQTSYRARSAPQDVYLQWLQDPECQWLSMEDKRTKDRDESRSNVLTTLLANTYQLLTEVQCLYRSRWMPQSTRKALSKKAAGKASQASRSDREKMPFGLVVFDGKDHPQVLKPKWIIHQFEGMGFKWPSNFNRATLRHALAQRGLDGDELDAFLGHGALAERVHDRHSLFDVAGYHQRLDTALADWAQIIGLMVLRLPQNMKPPEKDMAIQRKRAKFQLTQGDQPPPKKRGLKINAADDPVQMDFQRWCAFVQRTLERSDKRIRGNERGRQLAHLRPWHAKLFEICSQKTHAFAQYILGIPCDLQVLQVFHGPILPKERTALEASHQDTGRQLQALVVSWVAQGVLNRSVAAHGMNLSYALCKALDASMPTMWLAMTPHARVSPFTQKRISHARQANHRRLALLNAAREQPTINKLCGQISTLVDAEQCKKLIQEERARINLMLGTLMNMTAHPVRWVACAAALQSLSKPRDHVLEGDYEYRINGHNGRHRDCRGLLEVVSTHLSPLPGNEATTPRKARAREQFAAMWPQSAQLRCDLGQWVEGVRWFAHLNLPPLVAAHLEGSLDDQCVDGPLAECLGLSQSPMHELPLGSRVKSGKPPVVRKNDPQDGEAVFPALSEDEGFEQVPFGWLNAPGNGDAAELWLQRYLWLDLGGPNDGASLEDLSETLMEAVDEVPSRIRRPVLSLVRRIRDQHGLEATENGTSEFDQVDRTVVDFATYERLLSQLQIRCQTKRHSERQSRVRLLLMMAFRFGMRRGEILLLRQGDVDLLGEGRIHVRPYGIHTLKTPFAKRSLPIQPLLDERERAWLKHAHANCSNPSQPLIPKAEHDTLAREAIALLREVGGSNRLKLHHLRHSFASWMALKVVFARHPQWGAIFERYPEIQREMSKSRQQLVGSVLKPYMQAGDFMVIPRLMGHSSYEVSLSNYVHTLDMVAVLFVSHDLADQIVPMRDLPQLIHQRYEAVVALRQKAAPLAPSAHCPTPVNPMMTPPSETLATKINDLLLTLTDPEQQAGANEPMAKGLGNARIARTEALAGCHGAEIIDAGQLQNWFSPRHAHGLPDMLLNGVNQLDEADVAALVQIGQAHWRDQPAMFHFGVRPLRQADEVVDASTHECPGTPANTDEHQDCAKLLQILDKMGLGQVNITLWRRAKADAEMHAKVWDDVVRTVGHQPDYRRLAGDSRSASFLGVSVGKGSARRSPLIGTLWRALSLLGR